MPGLTHWDPVTHICASKLTIIGEDNGLSPGRRQAIIWTNAGISLIVPLGTNFSENIIEIFTFSFKNMHLKMSSEKWLFCLGSNVLKLSHISKMGPWMSVCIPWPLLLTWFNFNPSMIKYLHPLNCMGWNCLSIPNPQRCNRWSLEVVK